jgi:hypothetical protein
MRQLFLHVGMHKTGTSSIQQTLAAHRAILDRAGLSWFEADEPNHSRAVYSAFTESPHLYHVNRRHRLHGPAEAAAFAAEQRRKLLAFLETAPGPSLLLSGEDIGTLGEPGIRRMLAAFRPHVDRIVAIGLVRPPRGFIASAIQQRIRGGALLDGVEEGAVQPRYRARFEPFLTAPEVAELRLQLYRPDRLIGGCSVATLLHQIGAPPSLYPMLEVSRANAGSSRLGVVLALAANRAVPVFLADGRANPERAARLTRFLDTLEGTGFAVPEALVAPHLDRAAADIAWMEARLGEAFTEAEKRPASGDLPASPLDRLEGEELLALARGLNGLFRELEAARAARQQRQEGQRQEGRRAWR